MQELDRRLEELERELGHAYMGWVVGALSGWTLWVGDVAGARQRADRMLGEMRRARRTSYIWSQLRTLGTAHLLRGEFAEMPSTLGLEERTERSAPDEYMEMAKAVLAEARGDLDEARAAVNVSKQVTTRLRIWPNLVLETLYLAGIERRAGNGQLAASLYREATDEWVKIRGDFPPVTEVVFSTQFALEAAAQGDTTTLTRCREKLEPYGGLVSPGGTLAIPILVDRALGVIAAAEGRWEEAIGYLERGEAFCQEKGLAVELAHCRLALADALMHRNPATGEKVDESPISEGDQLRATALCDQALVDYQGLGMPLYVQDVLARREVLRA